VIDLHVDEDLRRISGSEANDLYLADLDAVELNFIACPERICPRARRVAAAAAATPRL